MLCKVGSGSCRSQCNLRTRCCSVSTRFVEAQKTRHCVSITWRRLRGCARHWVRMVALTIWRRRSSYLAALGDLTALAVDFGNGYGWSSLLFIDFVHLRAMPSSLLGGFPSSHAIGNIAENGGDSNEGKETKNTSRGNDRNDRSRKTTYRGRHDDRQT